MSFPWLWRPVCAVIFMTALSAGTALAQSARVGSLQCHLSGGVGMILIENQALDCVYQDESGAPPSHSGAILAGRLRRSSRQHRSSLHIRRD